MREFNTQGPLVMQLKAETNRYLNKFHDERRQRLALLLDSEEWRPAEVPKELQEAIDDVLAQGQGVLKTGVIPVRPKRPGKLKLIMIEFFFIVFSYFISCRNFRRQICRHWMLASHDQNDKSTIFKKIFYNIK